MLRIEKYPDGFHVVDEGGRVVVNRPFLTADGARTFIRHHFHPVSR